MKAIKIIIGAILLISSVSTILNGVGSESGPGLIGFLLGAGVIGLIGGLLLNSGLKK